MLKRPGAAERAGLAVAIEEAADAVETIVTEGAQAAMNRVNGRRLSRPTQPVQCHGWQPTTWPSRSGG